MRSGRFALGEIAGNRGVLIPADSNTATGDRNDTAKLGGLRGTAGSLARIQLVTVVLAELAS